MKKIILFLLTLVTCAAVSGAAADDLKDNSLQIDDSRLEKKEGLKFGLQSEQIKELFNEATQKRLQDMQQHQEEQLITERGQLFSAIQRPVKKSSEEQLFQPNAQKTIKFQTNRANSWRTKTDYFLSLREVTVDMSHKQPTR